MLVILAMLPGFFLGMLISLPAIAGMRRVLTRRVSRLMKTASPSTAAGESLSRAAEVPAGSAPRIAVLDADSDEARSEEARRTEAAEGSRLFVQWWLLEIAGAALTLALAGAAMVASGAPLAEMFAYRGGGAYVVSSAKVDYFIFRTGIGWDVAGYIAVVTVRFLFYWRYYRGGGVKAARKMGWLRRWVTMLFEEVFRAVFHPRHAWFPFLLFAFFALDFERDYELDLVYNVILLGLALHFAARFWFARLARSGANRKLLILRVFGRNENSVLTFGALRGFWSYVGSSFTVVDRSYLAFRYRGHSEDHIFAVFSVYSTFTLLTLLSGRPAPTVAEFASIGLLSGLIVTVFYAIYLIVVYFGASQYFASDRAHIKVMIARLFRRPRRFWPLTYRNLDMHCYDDTWREAVAEFVSVTDIVLMDLRGYSEERRGCEYEVDFLFDFIAAERIVLLTDGDNSLELVKALIHQRWEMLSVESPNLGRPVPTVTIYCSRDGRANDMRGLTNVLAARIEQGSAEAHAPAMAV